MRESNTRFSLSHVSLSKPSYLRSFLSFPKFTEVRKWYLVDSDCTILWQQFLMFTYHCFGVSERGSNRYNTTLATVVNNALSYFLSTNSQPLPPSRQRKKRRVNDSTTDSNLVTCVSAKIEESDVRLAVSYDTLASCSDDVADALHLLHPQREASTHGSTPPETVDRSVSQNVLQLTTEDFVEAISSRIILRTRYMTPSALQGHDVSVRWRSWRTPNGSFNRIHQPVFSRWPPTGRLSGISLSDAVWTGK